MTNDELALLDLIEQPIFVLEPDGHGLPRYVAFNACASRSLKRPRAEIIGKTAAEIYGGRMGQVALDRHLSALATGEETTHTIILPFDDGPRMIRTVLRPVRGADGRVTRIVATSTDARAQPSLQDTASRLQRHSDDVEHFVHLAAHDLRAPMRHVATLASMMREDFHDLGDERLELLGLLEGVSAKTLALIGDLLSHAQAGSVSETTSCFEFGALLEDVCVMLDPFGTCTLVRPDGWISGDRTAVQIVLRNLIDNAMKYGAESPDGAPACRTLTFSLAPLDAAFFTLRLRDNGPGFDADTLETLADGAFTNEGGYGLMAIRRLITARGGDLRVANQPEGGAEITVTLPGQWVEDGYGPAVPAPRPLDHPKLRRRSTH